MVRAEHRAARPRVRRRSGWARSRGCPGRCRHRSCRPPTRISVAPQPRETGRGGRLTLGRTQGVALYAGAVLGSGVLVIPAVAAELAGPASLVAWGAMTLLTLPLALT